MKRIYACIDLKSFYASVECVMRNLDPLTTNLVVADITKTEKTICLAVSPSLKEYGLGGRERLYKVITTINNENYKRYKNNNYHKLVKKSYNKQELDKFKNTEIDFIIASPRMKKYMEYSAKIYGIYLKFLSKDDVFVYSIDEIFCDITDYLTYYNQKPEELITSILNEIYKETGITATAGIGTNLYLAKVAMDIVAKTMKQNRNGARIASLDICNYRKLLWNHVPITDFWRIGSGYRKQLEKLNLYTMGDIANYSINHEDELFKVFGVNAEILIDHSWGYEYCNLKDIKSFTPSKNSISSNQVLTEPYDYIKTRLVVKEMADLLALRLVYHNLKTNQLVLTIGYDKDNLIDSSIKEEYTGDIVYDGYGRKIPKHSHGTINLKYYTSSSKTIINYFDKLYNRIINNDLLVRKVGITACNLKKDKDIKEDVLQIDIFGNYKNDIQEKKDDIEETKLQNTIINLKNKYGKNSILKGMNKLDGATTINRNKQIGGHKA